MEGPLKGFWNLLRKYSPIEKCIYQTVKYYLFWSHITVLCQFRTIKFFIVKLVYINLLVMTNDLWTNVHVIKINGLYLIYIKKTLTIFARFYQSQFCFYVFLFLYAIENYKLLLTFLKITHFYVKSWTKVIKFSLFFHLMPISIIIILKTKSTKICFFWTNFEMLWRLMY